MLLRPVSVVLPVVLVAAPSWTPAAPVAAVTPPPGLAAHVDPFLGIDSGGNVFPGPTVPFGVVKLGPDTTTENPNAGYTSDGEIVGFSHLHVSGTGAAPSTASSCWRRPRASAGSAATPRRARTSRRASATTG